MLCRCYITEKKNEAWQRWCGFS